jgi:hypothetical protein
LFFWVNEVTKTLTDSANTAFCLAISLVVVRGGHFELNLKVPYKLLPGVQGKSTVSLRDNRAGVSVNSNYLFQNNLGRSFNIDILGDREQVYIATEAIKNNKIEVIFLVTR